jgi:hypothetical protein
MCIFNPSDFSSLVRNKPYRDRGEYVFILENGAVTKSLFLTYATPWEDRGGTTTMAQLQARQLHDDLRRRHHNLRNPARVLSLIYITYIGGKPELSSTTWDSIRVERKKAHAACVEENGAKCEKGSKRVATNFGAREGSA